MRILVPLILPRVHKDEVDDTSIPTVQESVASKLYEMLDNQIWRRQYLLIRISGKCMLPEKDETLVKPLRLNLSGV